MSRASFTELDLDSTGFPLFPFPSTSPSVLSTTTVATDSPVCLGSSVAPSESVNEPSLSSPPSLSVPTHVIQTMDVFFLFSFSILRILLWPPPPPLSPSPSTWTWWKLLQWLLVQGKRSVSRRRWKLFLQTRRTSLMLFPSRLPPVFSYSSSLFLDIWLSPTLLSSPLQPSTSASFDSSSLSHRPPSTIHLDTLCNPSDLHDMSSLIGLSKGRSSLDCVDGSRRFGAFLWFSLGGPRTLPFSLYRWTFSPCLINTTLWRILSSILLFLLLKSN